MIFQTIHPNRQIQQSLTARSPAMVASPTSKLFKLLPDLQQHFRNHHSQIKNCLVVILIISGCKSPPSTANRGYVDMELQHRTFHDVAPHSCPGEISIPPCVVLEDGLSEEEAVALALWNNRTFLSTLSNLGIARGDLVQAGLLTNPQLNLLFPPIGSKQLEWTLFVPIEALILRKQRITIAERDFQRIANDLVQSGLNVARDARVAYADFQFAINRYDLAKEAVDVRQGIADLAEKRLEGGDIGELEAITTRIDANRTRAEAAGLEQAVQIAEATLKNVMGIAILETPLYPVSETIPDTTELSVDELVSEALMIRPDIKAARIAVQAASHRVELAKRSFLRIDAVADGNSGGAGPTNSGPGLRFEIPIFNRNQGLIIRSEWTVDQANHNYQSIRDQVVTDVKVAFGGLQQAQSNLNYLQSDVLPELKESMMLSERSYRDGGTDYFLVLQSSSQYIDSQIRQLELTAASRKAIAELDRSVGRRIVCPYSETISYPKNNDKQLENPVPGLLMPESAEAFNPGTIGGSLRVVAKPLSPRADQKPKQQIQPAAYFSNSYSIKPSKTAELQQNLR
tara:strand:- start:438 stop:2150 length:1713 start_codon:yes stop_codon:yes gene_type:complete